MCIFVQTIQRNVSIFWKGFQHEYSTALFRLFTLVLHKNDTINQSTLIKFEFCPGNQNDVRGSTTTWGRDEILPHRRWPSLGLRTKSASPFSTCPAGCAWEPSRLQKQWRSCATWLRLTGNKLHLLIRVKGALLTHERLLGCSHGEKAPDLPHICYVYSIILFDNLMFWGNTMFRSINWKALHFDIDIRLRKQLFCVFQLYIFFAVVPHTCSANTGQGEPVFLTVWSGLRPWQAQVLSCGSTKAQTVHQRGTVI